VTDITSPAANDGGQLCQILQEESGTLESNGVVQGLLGHGSVKVEEKRAAKVVAGGSRGNLNIHASRSN
jgi:hypothetical protein